MTDTTVPRVEPNYRLGDNFDTFAVVVPRAWAQTTSSITKVVGDANGLSLASEIETALPSPQAAASGFLFVPSNRDDARWLFSARERAVYLVGGQTADVPTGELWRNDLDTGLWQHLFGPGPHRQERVGNVLALGYDEARGKLVVLDVLPPRTPGPQPVTRIVVFDTHKMTSRVVAVPTMACSPRWASGPGMTARSC